MLRDKTLIVLFGLSLLTVSAGFLLVLFGLPGGSSNLILQFSAARGIDILGSRGEALSAFGVILAVGVINVVLSREIYYRERFLSYLVALVTLVVGIVTLVAAGVVVSVN
jgi:hypothetical protein